MECDAFISRLGVRHKPQQITDYKPVEEPPEIMGFDAESSLLPPAAIHQHKSKTDLKTQKFTSCYRRASFSHAAYLKNQQDVIGCFLKSDTQILKMCHKRERERLEVSYL